MKVEGTDCCDMIKIFEIVLIEGKLAKHIFVMMTFASCSPPYLYNGGGEHKIFS
jgi:hypothetical protein